MHQPEIERLLATYPDMLTVEEVATLLRVHRRSVQRWASQGRFAAVRAGRTYRIPRADVLRWLTSSAHPDDKHATQQTQLAKLV